MSWSAAKRVADEWCAKNLPDDMRGRALQMPSFYSHGECRFFYADRELGYHRMIIQAIARTARKRGAEKIVYVRVPMPAHSSTQEERTKIAEAAFRIVVA